MGLKKNKFSSWTYL